MDHRKYNYEEAKEEFMGLWRSDFFVKLIAHQYNNISINLVQSKLQ